MKGRDSVRFYFYCCLLKQENKEKINMLNTDKIRVISKKEGYEKIN